MTPMRDHVTRVTHSLNVAQNVPVHTFVPLVGHIVLAGMVHFERVINCNIALHATAQIPVKTLLAKGCIVLSCSADNAELACSDHWLQPNRMRLDASSLQFSSWLRSIGLR